MAVIKETFKALFDKTNRKVISLLYEKHIGKMNLGVILVAFALRTANTEETGMSIYLFIEIK